MIPRPGYKVVKLVCPVCSTEFDREKPESERNIRLGRAQLCSRKCHATYMNQSPAKLANTRAILAERNAKQVREKNPNWKGGISGKLKPLPTKGHLPSVLAALTAEVKDGR